jgi:hypothetical protein
MLKTFVSNATQDFSKEDPVTPPLTYEAVPRSLAARKEELRIAKVIKWLQDLIRPDDMTDSDYSTFIRYCSDFFFDSNRLWRRNSHGLHKLVAPESQRIDIMRQCHDDVGHKGFYATHALVAERFFWPHMKPDIVWFVRSCHWCQIRQLRHILIPPVVATPAPLFSRVYIDTMHMPASGGFHYIVEGRCSLTHYAEFRMLRTETAKTLGDWIYEDILCRWGSLREIVTDNGRPFLTALEYLAKRYHINHIRISGYNSRANGLVERPHFDVRQSLFKAVDGIESRWSRATYSVFWAERVTIRRRMGCSPYFAATGCHPLLPLDIVEATYLQPPPSSILSTTDLIARRAIALQKRSQDLHRLHSAVYSARCKAARRFEKVHARTIRDFDFHRGDLVLVRNTAIEKSLNRKMRPRYEGPFIIVSRNYGGAYIVAELDGSLFHRPIAAFRVVPYLSRKFIAIPDDFGDVDTKRIRELESQDFPENDELPDFPDRDDNSESEDDD